MHAQTFKYAGIGSRETPYSICSILTDLANYLFDCGYTCVSGGAEGADKAFQAGAHNKCEVWRPKDATTEAYDLAEDFHPRWDRLTPSARGLHARNGHILLGQDLNTPVDFVLCWTEHGLEKGGTAQGIRIARAYGIPLYNLGNPKATFENLDDFLKKFLTLSE